MKYFKEEAIFRKLIFGYLLIFDKNFDFWQKIWLLTKNLTFDKKFDFWQKIWLLTKILTFDKKFDFWQKIWLLTKNLICATNLDLCKKIDFCNKFWFLQQILIFDKNFSFFYKNSKINVWILSFFFGCLKMFGYLLRKNYNLEKRRH